MIPHYEDASIMTIIDDPFVCEVYGAMKGMCASSRREMEDPTSRSTNHKLTMDSTTQREDALYSYPIYFLWLIDSLPYCGWLGLKFLLIPFS